MARPNREYLPRLRLFDPTGEDIRAGTIGWDEQPFEFEMDPATVLPGLYTTFLQYTVETDRRLTPGEYVIPGVVTAGSSERTVAGETTITVGPQMASVSVAKAPKRTEGIHKWATFKVALSKPSDESVRVNFQTISETAKTRKDFVAKKGLLTFAPGQRTKTVRVRIVNEKTAERTEGFTLALRGGRGVTLKNNKAGGTIRDND